MKLTTVQRDRALGVLLGTAAGDALGAGYEFGPPIPAGTTISMIGGGPFGWQPGEWTDDTSMAIAIAEVAATGANLRNEKAQDAIVTRWEDWASTAKDVGHQTRAVLGRVNGGGAAAAREVSASLHERTGKTAGNGSLMRTAPVALAYLDDPDGLSEAASVMAALTHHDGENGEACALWCHAIRHAVLTGELDIRVGLAYLGADRRDVWAARLDVAERRRPADFEHNGWVVEALQAAWSSIATTRVPVNDPVAGVFRADHLRLALANAVRGGRDTDTVAAIAGGLLGAAHGASAVPAEWRSLLHGWPGYGSRDLTALTAAIVRGGAPDGFDYTYRGHHLNQPVVAHPHDDGVLLADVRAIRDLPPGVDVVISLCRVQPDRTAVTDWIEVFLIDTPDPTENQHLDFVLADTVAAIVRHRDAGRTVLVHCVAAQSRTPAVAALYSMRRHRLPATQALADVCAVLVNAQPNRTFRAALARAGKVRE